MGSLPSKRGYSAIQATLTNSQANLAGVADKCIFVALYNFPAGGQTDISVRLGEQLNVLSEDGEWWKVMSVISGRECYIPRDYVAKVYNRAQLSHVEGEVFTITKGKYKFPYVPDKDRHSPSMWLFKGINREKAEELLLMSSNRTGSFLIRESETRRGCYSLSVRKSNQVSRDSIKHYRINQLENGWLYISPRLTFATLQDIVDYYSEIADGICCILKDPCIIQGFIPPVVPNTQPIIVRRPTLNWTDLDSSALFTEDSNLNEDCPLSLGLREAVSSYMFMTEDKDSKTTALERKHRWKP